MPTPADRAATQEPLAAGWEALADTDWEGARAIFAAALEREPSGEAFEGLSHAAWWLDEAATMFEAREGAYRRYRRGGDLRSAGRVATFLGIDYFSFRGEAAIGNGRPYRNRSGWLGGVWRTAWGLDDGVTVGPGGDGRARRVFDACVVPLRAVNGSGDRPWWARVSCWPSASFGGGVRRRR